MKISETIARLKEIKKEHGDIEVTIGAGDMDEGTYFETNFEGKHVGTSGGEWSDSIFGRQEVGPHVVIF